MLYYIYGIVNKYRKIESMKAIGDYIDDFDNLITLHRRKYDIEKNYGAFGAFYDKTRNKSFISDK